MFISMITFFMITTNPAVKRISSSPDEVVLEFTSKDGEGWSELVAVPIDGDISTCKIVPYDSVISAKISGKSRRISISERMTLRGIDFRVIKINPAGKGPDGRTVVYTKGLVVIKFTGRKFVRWEAESYDFKPLYASFFVNGDVITSQIRRWTRGGYLIVVHDSLANDITPLVRWKRRLGYAVRVVRVSEISQNPTAQEIKDYVRNVYETWDVPLTYLLLVGDNTMVYGQMPTFWYHDATDDAFYGMLEGDDYLPEVMVGRMAVDNPSELRTAIAKVIAYESDPAHDGTAWLNRALMIAGVYVHGSDTVNTTKLTKLRIKDDLQALGMEVDTIFWEITHGGSFTEIVNSINQGVSVVNYRGWSNSTGWVYPQFYRDHIPMLNNGHKLPVMFSISCGTGNFASTTDPSFGEAWIRAGTPSSMKGGPAFLGPSDPFTHTKWNNAIDAGIFHALYHEGITSFRVASTAGLMNLIRSFPDYSAPGMEVEFYFHVYTVIGDPSLSVWTEIPEPINASITDFMPHIGSNSIGINFDADTAFVAVLLGDSLLESHMVSGGAGYSSFTLTQDASGQWVYVVISAPNRIPFVDSALVTGENGFEILNAQWVELQGNGDNIVNPGELFELDLTLKNSGSTNLSNPVIRIAPFDTSSIAIRNGVVHYSGTVSPNATFTVNGFELEFSDILPDMEPLGINVMVTSGALQMVGGLFVTPYAPMLKISQFEINDANGNGYLEPGESATLEMVMRNDGHEDAEDVSLCVSDHPLWHVTSDCSTFDRIGVGDSVVVEASVIVSNQAVSGRTGMLDVNMECSGFSGEWRHWLAIGPLDSTAVIGPDCYGYWLYEPGIDSFIPDNAHFPMENWIELEYMPEADTVPFDENGLAVLHLPNGVTIGFYGRTYDKITVSRYGWIAMDSTDLFYYRNWPIPSPTMPDRIIAPFWDHLIGGRVFYYHDYEHNLLIIEWDNMQEFSHPDVTQKFELVFNLDPVSIPESGDNSIMFVYHTISDIDSSENYSTIGIGNREYGCGLLYKYAGEYSSQLVGTLHDGKILIFSPIPPDTMTYDIGEDEIRGRGKINVALYGNNELIINGLDGVEIPYSIISVSGRTVKTGRVSSRLNKIRINGLPAGVYILKVGEKAVKFEKIY